MAVKQAKAMSVGHAAGIYADMSLDGPEIGTLVAVVDRAKNLPNRRTMGKQDPYCAMRLGKEAKKTETDRRGGQTPRWDQELRFNVHDSPDYYKLKCSVFNDDKKTELIGEAWLDLREVIVPGGGQNDLWHQLNFKGKYAGDIRIELTYYDTRTNPELEASKQRQKEKVNSNGGMGTGSASRQLGPREIKRRPLPPGPVPAAPAELPQPLHIQRQLPPQPGVPQASQHHFSAPTNANPYAPPTQPQWTPPNDPSDYAFDRSEHIHNPYAANEDPYQQEDYHDAYSQNNVCHSDGYPESPQSYDHPPRPDLPHSHSEPQPGWHEHSSPLSSPYQPGSSPYALHNSSPPVRQSPPTLPEIPPRTHRLSVSPTKYTAYRDSPLRQSISQHEVPSQMVLYNDLHDDLDLQPPPPPPTHRDSLPRASSSTHNTPPHPEQFRRLPQLPHTIEDRSPLQMIEQQYSPPHQAQRKSERRQDRHSFSPSVNHDRQPSVADPSDDAQAGDFPAPHQLSQNYGVDFVTEPIEQDRQGRYIRRNSGLDDSPYSLPQRAHTFDTADNFDERNTYRSEPQLVRPRAVSPNAGHSIPRKSVSPHPAGPGDRTRFSGVPFGPDSYDVLNPGSDPMTDPFSTPENTRGAGRQKEVERMGDQGPIIGNDGRVIDPSDHLPSDTWAPEPERRTRQPEHVIRIKTRDEARNSRIGTSPMPIKPVSAPMSPHQPTPDPSPAPSSGNRRNRLQKPMPNRPLPTQPFPHPHSSPASIPQVADFHPPPPPRNSLPSSPMSGQRHSIYNTPPSGPPRPRLSDYQVPTGNSYSSPRQHYPPQQNPSTPTKMPQRPQSYAPRGGYDDPLAAELSMIDIGPSRGGRTALRSGRAYGGY